MWQIFLTWVFAVASLVKCDNVINAVEVKTKSGWVRGYEETYNDHQLFRFVKIPFAKPPVGKLRFRDPQPIGEWDDVKGISGTKSPTCSQWFFPLPGHNVSDLTEDCLYLNIYVPGKISPERNLSVMVWIYGGGFMFGAANQYKPHPLVTSGNVIVVTLNYRLALLGFFTMHDPLLSGNFGIKDQIEALRWVQNNIEAFGGNPKSVTLFGQSAGGYSVSILTMIPSNEGLFQRAITQSGVVSVGAFSRKEWEEKTKITFLERTNCNNKGSVAETLSCLQDLPVENITNALSIMDITARSPLNVTFEAGGFLPNIDGELINEDIAYPKSHDDESYKFFRSLDYMSGTLDGEGNMLYIGMTPGIQEKYDFRVLEKIPRSVVCEVAGPSFVNRAVGNVPELSQQICDFYTTTKSVDAQSNKACECLGDYAFIVPSNILLSIHAKDNRRNTFQYLITKPSPVRFGGEPPSWFTLGAGHGDDVRLMFDFIDASLLPEEKKEEVNQEKGLHENVVKYWTNFAKFGNPNGENVPDWPSYDVTNNKQYVILDTPIKTGENLKAGATELFYKILDQGHRQLKHDEL